MAEAKGNRFFVMSVTATVEEGREEDMLAQFASLALEGKLAGADSVELNLSCPNVLPGEGGETFTDAKLSGSVVDSVRRSVGSGFPIFVKVGVLDDYSELVERTYDEGIAYVAVNSVPAEVRGPSGEILFLDRGGRAGICGAAIREGAKRAVSSLAALKRGGREFKVIGLGGILGPQDALALLGAGADAVESATGALLDPCLGLKTRLALLEAKAGGGR
jgi:dihydroorotate dehydrogenase